MGKGGCNNRETSSLSLCRRPRLPLPSHSPCTHPVPRVLSLSPCGELWVLAAGLTQVIPALGDIGRCPTQPQDAGTGDADIPAGSQPLECPRAAAGASAHLLRLESLQLGGCCHLLCWERVFSLPPPPADLLSPGLGWRVGSPNAFSAEHLPRRRRSQQTRRQTEVPFPRGPLERSLQRDLGAGRLSTSVPVITADGCFCPSGPAANLSLTGMSGQTPALQLRVSPAPTPPETCRPDREGRCCSQRCQLLPRTWGGCRSSPADQASHAAHSAFACCRRSSHRVFTRSHSADSFQTSWRGQNRSSRQD